MPSCADTLAVTIGRLKRLVAQLDVVGGTERIEETTYLFEGGLDLDSFAVVELVVAIEEEFGGEFPEQALTPESFHDLRTLGAVVARSFAASG